MVLHYIKIYKVVGSNTVEIKTLAFGIQETQFAHWDCTHRGFTQL